MLKLLVGTLGLAAVMFGDTPTQTAAKSDPCGASACITAACVTPAVSVAACPPCDECPPCPPCDECP